MFFKGRPDIPIETWNVFMSTLTLYTVLTDRYVNMWDIYVDRLLRQKHVLQALYMQSGYYHIYLFFWQVDMTIGQRRADKFPLISDRSTQQCVNDK